MYGGINAYMVDMTGIAKRMKVLADLCGGALALAEASDVSYRTVRNAIDGMVTRKTAIALASTAGVDVGWLWSGDGPEPGPDLDRLRRIEAARRTPKARGRKTHSVSVKPLNALAAVGALNEEWVTAVSRKDPRALACWAVETQEAEPWCREGDSVVVDLTEHLPSAPSRSLASYSSNRRFLITQDGVFHVRQWSGNSWIAENIDFRPITESAQVIGAIIAVFSRK